MTLPTAGSMQEPLGPLTKRFSCHILENSYCSRRNQAYLNENPKVNKSLDSALNNISDSKPSLHNKGVVNAMQTNSSNIEKAYIDFSYKC
jgi:hypothetical protein